jgi:hypothetical protein
MKPASIAVLLACSLACSLAVAGARAQRQQLPEPSADQAAAAEAPATPAAPLKRKPTKRRSVQQVIEPTPRIVTDGYRPALTVRPPATVPEPLPAPLRMNSCDAGGCYDTGGARYNGVGTTLLGPQGQLCTRGAVTTQCF